MNKRNRQSPSPQVASQRRRISPIRQSLSLPVDQRLSRRRPSPERYSQRHQSPSENIQRRSPDNRRRRELPQSRDSSPSPVIRRGGEQERRGVQDYKRRPPSVEHQSSTTERYRYKRVVYDKMPDLLPKVKNTVLHLHLLPEDGVRRRRIVKGQEVDCRLDNVLSTSMPHCCHGVRDRHRPKRRVERRVKKRRFLQEGRLLCARAQSVHRHH